MAKSRYDELHFFIDESGEFHSHKKFHQRLAFVGGVLLFGKYDRAANDRLLAILRARLEEAGGQFPNDMHFSEGKNPPKPCVIQLVKNLSQPLQEWCGDERALYGISLKYEADLANADYHILSELKSDYRYLSMLWSLVEHLVFVDGNISQRLTPDATLHLHVGNRAYVFHEKSQDPQELRDLGFRVEKHRKKEQTWVVPEILDHKTLLNMVRMAVRQRWRQSINLGEIEVPRIRYESRPCPAALYLADLYLGLVRQSELSSMFKNHVAIKAAMVPVFRRLPYGPWLELLARMQAALNDGDIESYLAAAEEYDLLPQKLSTFTPVRERQERTAGKLLAALPARIERVLEDASRLVDAPGQAEIGLRQSKRMLGLLAEPSLRAQVLALQTELSHANHTGQVERADEVFTQYESLEPQLTSLGYEGLRLKAEMRNRRAVTLIDSFRYAEAEAALDAVIGDQEVLQRALLDAARGVAHVPNRELGACCGTLGQLHAFQGTPERWQQAEASFHRAAECFTDPADVDRQWIYLGHLACDQGPAGEPLWHAVQERFAVLRTNKPHCVSGRQYLLALQLKGVLTFANIGNVRQFLSQWKQVSLPEHFERHELAQHPFGLVHQAVALLAARAWRESGESEYADHAQQAFDRAIELLGNGGALLKSLGRFAEIRKLLLRHERTPDDARIETQLADKFQVLRGELASQFGTSAWGLDESTRPLGHFSRLDLAQDRTIAERAASVLTGIRFNYW